MLFSMPSRDGGESLIAITTDSSILRLHVTYSPSPSLIIRSQSELPIPLPRPKAILPVDPMAWGFGNSWMQHDVLLSISAVGELAFWVPEERVDVGSGWRCTGKVKTERTNIKKASCSSAKKTALSKSSPSVCPTY